MFLNELGRILEIMVMDFFMECPAIFLEKLRNPGNIPRRPGL
jgi:hypothetical protein